MCIILSTCISMPELSHTFFVAFVLSTFHKFSLSLSLSLSPPVPPMVPLRFPLSLPWSPMAPRELASIGLPVCLSRFPPGSPNTYNRRKNRNDKNKSHIDIYICKLIPNIFTYNAQAFPSRPGIKRGAYPLLFRGS
jgi:hypothetical protein